MIQGRLMQCIIPTLDQHLYVQGGAHKDLFLGYGSIVGFLIAAHVAALLVWIFLLARGGDRRPAKKIATD